MVPLLRVVVPIEQTILLIAPAMAACSLVGWMAGGRFWLAAVWTGLATWMLVTPLPAGGGFDAVTRGWALTLAAAFGLGSALGARRSFFSRALTATGITFAVALSVVVVARVRPERVADLVSSELSRRLDSSAAQWQETVQRPEWHDFAQKYPNAASVIEGGEQQIRAVPAVTSSVFAALLGLESLVVLALAWSLYHRAARIRIGAPLRPLAEFRFSDQLVWGVVLGVTLMVVPSLSESRGIGLNLALFFAVLYALRGLGVLAWFLAPRRPALVLLVIAALLAWPVVGVFALGLGLADTWIDWRGRARPIS